MSIRPPCKSRGPPSPSLPLFKIIDANLGSAFWGQKQHNYMHSSSHSVSKTFFTNKDDASLRTSHPDVHLQNHSCSLHGVHLFLQSRSRRSCPRKIAPRHLEETLRLFCACALSIGSDCVQIHNRSWVQPRTGSAYFNESTPITSNSLKLFASPMIHCNTRPAIKCTDCFIFL